METTIDIKTRAAIAHIPEISDLTKIFIYITKYSAQINANYFVFLKELTNLNDETISGWLNINARTFRTYRQSGTLLKDNTKEHIVILISLYNHGLEVFENNENFDKWLMAKNYLLDGKAPMEFLDTISGIKFIDDRLTAIQYGDNV
jgi:uncharacterized protein (DUF2384 family)